MSTTATAPRPIRSLIPARLDRLNWSPFHTRMVCGLEQVTTPLTSVAGKAAPAASAAPTAA